jgi:putative CocE/NonD family hydrolase
MRGKPRAHALAVIFGFLVSTAAPKALIAQEGTTHGSAGVDMLWGVKIPMRDGISLNATVFRPKAQTDPLPVIFTLTPYIGDSYIDRAMYFARHGYLYALVDVRGRGNSGGTFAPFENDAKDGYDIVEWFAKQSWCDGKLAMWGGSYAGFDLWATLKEFPPHLATVVPAAAAHAGVDFPYDSNVAPLYLMQWLSFTSGVTSNARLFGEDSYWEPKWREVYRQHLPFKSLDVLVGNPSPMFQKWLAHPIPDAYLDALAPTADDYRKIRIPILTITGSYDGDQAGAMTYYRRHMQYGNGDAKAQHYLVIGPWDHAGTRTPNREVGGLKFGEASMVDLNQLHLEWYDWTMKNGRRPRFLEKRVMYYVMGEDKWKAADTLEAAANDTLKLALDSDGTAGDVFHAGVLAAAAREGAPPDTFVYDPLDTRPGDAELFNDSASLTSQRDAMRLFGEGVVYHSLPFDRAIEATGYVKLGVWLAMDVPDTDLQASVYEIGADGSSVLLTQALMRARYRHSLRKPEGVPPNTPELYEFGNFMWFSRRLQKGSRIRLVFKCVNSIQIEKNYNSGGDVASETAKEARTAHVTLLHDTEHSSVLEIPVVKP